VSFREPNGAVMTNMKPPQEGRNTGAPSLRGLQGRSATGLNGQAAKEEVSALWRGGWMPENISGVPAGRSVFHLTSPLIGLLARNTFRMCPSSARKRRPASTEFEPPMPTSEGGGSSHFESIPRLHGGIRPNQGAARTARRPQGSFGHDLVVRS
jgi:hypothetical protein